MLWAVVFDAILWVRHDIPHADAYMVVSGCASDHVRACDQASLVMTCYAGEPYLVTASRQNVLNVVLQKPSRVLVVGIADFRCCLHLQCLPVPRDCTSADQTVRSIQALLSALRRLTMGTDLPKIAQVGHWNRGYEI